MASHSKRALVDQVSALTQDAELLQSSIANLSSRFTTSSFPTRRHEPCWNESISIATNRIPTAAADGIPPAAGSLQSATNVLSAAKSAASLPSTNGPTADAGSAATISKYDGDTKPRNGCGAR
jgi:hypothetical protein